MIIRRFRRLWKEHGKVGMIRQIVRRVCPVHVSLVYRKTDVSDFCKIHGLSVVRYPLRSTVDVETIKEIEAAWDYRLVQEIEKLFSKDCELWLGRFEGRIVGICWSRSGQNRTDYFVGLEETDATILSCFVFPAFRGRGIFPAMLQTMVNMLMDHDQVSNVYIDCKSWNVPSIRGIQKAGFALIGSAVRMVLCGRVWILWNRCRTTQ